jgi:hypothetical protein
MTQQASLPGLPIFQAAKLSVRVEVSTEINISSVVARQRANQFLIAWVGDQLGAQEPEMVVTEQVHWRLPVVYAPSRLGPLGVVGHLLVDAQTGEVSIADGRSAGDLLASAEMLYERTTLSPGA